MRLKYIIFIFTLLLIQGKNWAQIFNTQVQAKIEVTSNGEFFKITGFSTNLTDSNQSLRYVLSVIKNNPNNNNVSKNDQQGRFVLEPFQKMELSTTTININEQDRTIILLLVYGEDDKVLGKDRIEMNSIDENESTKTNIDKNNSISEDVSHSGADGIVLRGIVVENTKTKPGRDFYRKFQMEYLRKGINGEKIVKINEIMALGSNTKIQLVIGDDVVVQFFVNPRTDYIDQMVDYSIKQTNNYFTKLRNNRDIVRKY